MSSNIEKWKNEFDRWQCSGLTRAEYCRQNNIKLSTFDYWRHRLKDLAPKDSKFVKLPISFSSEIEPIIIEFPNQIRLKIPNNYHSETLSKILSDLLDLISC